jgi:hypothetical protein
MRAQHTSSEPTLAVKLGQEFRQQLQVMVHQRRLDMQCPQRLDMEHLHLPTELHSLRMGSPRPKIPMRSISSLAR